MSGNRHDGSPETWVGKVCRFDEGTPYLINQRVGVLAFWGIAQDGSGSAAQYVFGNGSWVIYACACLVFIASVILIFTLHSENELERRLRMPTASHQEKPGGGPKHYTPY